jgi:hypothetical protein
LDPWKKQLYPTAKTIVKYSEGQND